MCYDAQLIIMFALFRENFSHVRCANFNTYGRERRESLVSAASHDGDFYKPSRCIGCFVIVYDTCLWPIYIYIYARARFPIMLTTLFVVLLVSAHLVCIDLSIPRCPGWYCKGDPCNMDRRVIWTTSITTYQLLARYTLFCDDVMLVFYNYLSSFFIAEYVFLSKLSRIKLSTIPRSKKPVTFQPRLSLFCSTKMLMRRAVQYC